MSKRKPKPILKTDGTPDRRFKVNRAFKREGTPDRRFARATAPAPVKRSRNKPQKEDNDLEQLLTWTEANFKEEQAKKRKKKKAPTPVLDEVLTLPYFDHEYTSFVQKFEDAGYINYKIYDGHDMHKVSIYDLFAVIELIKWDYYDQLNKLSVKMGHKLSPTLQFTNSMRTKDMSQTLDLSLTKWGETDILIDQPYFVYKQLGLF